MTRHLSAEQKASRAEIKYRGARARHAKRKHLWAKLHKARNAALRAALPRGK